MRINFQGTAAVINDTHNPFHDQRAIHEMEIFLEELKPELLIKAGDLNDFYQLSKFNKNPERADKLQRDLNSTSAMNKRQRELLPDSRQILIDGNHEDRLRRYLWGDSPALKSLKALSIEELYGLKDNEIEHVNYEEGLFINGIFMVTHGDTVRANSGYTAKAMSDKHGGCGMIGHTHRGGSYYKRDRFGIYGWWENFCLCNLTPDWITNPNWQQGFSLVHFTKERFWVEPIQIIKGRFVYGGKIYGRKH